MNKSLDIQLHRYGLICENLSLLRKEIASILKDLDYEAWRNCDADEESLMKFSTICMSLSQPIGQKVEQMDEGSPIPGFRKLLKYYKELFGETSLNEEIFNIVMFERNSQIEAILKNSIWPNRLSAKLKLSLSIIALWFLFRIQLLTEFKIIAMEDTNLTTRLTTLSALFDQVEAASYSSKLLQEWQNNENLLNIARHIISNIDNKKAPLTEEEVTKYVNQAYEINVPQWINYKNTLFTLINHVCIPLSFQKKIINSVRNSVFKLMLQNEYDIRRQFIPSLLNRRFYLPHKPDIRTALPENFRQGTRKVGVSMNLNLTHTEIVSLYLALKGKYIKTDTDIYDFAYALTGYPIDQARFFKKVVWVAEHKQTLGIFLGLLRPQGSERNKYWNLTPYLFQFKNDNAQFSPSDLSSPYSNFIKHPETQNRRDWQEMNEIISAVIKTKYKE